MLALEKLEDVSFEGMVKVLSEHYIPKPSEIVLHFKFYNQIRNPGESVSTFISEIRDMVQFCNFGASLDAMIRDRLVCGIIHEQIQKRLLSKGNMLILAKPLSVTQAIETANKDIQLLQSQSVPVQTMKMNQGTFKTIYCY